jgi:hypothetical protein
MVRNILGAVSQFEKQSLVAKLRKARERIRQQKGRCEGNPGWKPVPEAVCRAARAAQKEGLSLRGIAADLASRDFLSRSGKRYGPQSIKLMLKEERGGRRSTTSRREQ